MSENFIVITEQVERRTYFKGRFTGKFVGALDAENSDLKTENFYDLEFTEAKICARKTDFRTWRDEEGDGEPEEFRPIEKFLTRLPVPVACEVIYDDSIKHFNLHVYEAKLKDYRLFNRFSEQNQLFTAIEGEISGYLKHYDTIETKKEIPAKTETPPAKLPAATANFPVDRADFSESLGSSKSFGTGYESGIGGAPPSANWGCAFGGFSLPSIGCASLLSTFFVAILIVYVVTAVIVAATSVFSQFGLFLLVLFSAFFKLFVVGTIFYVFIVTQSKLPRILKRFFQIILLLLVLLLWFS